MKAIFINSASSKHETATGKHQSAQITTALSARGRHPLTSKMALLAALSPLVISSAWADSLPDFERLVRELGDSVVNIEVQKSAVAASAEAAAPNFESLPEELRKFFEQNPQLGTPA